MTENEKQTEAHIRRAKALNKAQKYAQRAQKRAKSNNLKLRNLKYYLIETLRSLVRNKLMTLTSIATVAACLLIVVFSYAIAQNINHILAYIETTIGVEIFIDDALNDAEMETLSQQILAMDNVVSAEFISPVEALEHMAETLGDEEGILLSLLYDNPLRRSFRLELNDIRQQRETVDQLWQLYGVANIAAAPDMADALATANNYISIFSFIIILILGILSVIIITNTIKLTVNSRRNEILIMRYVGATDWFIKWPFVIEGVLIGIIGAGLSLTISWLSYDNIISSVREFQLIEQLQLPFRNTTEIFPIFAPITIILGAVIGILGSISSMRKYLSV